MTRALICGGRNYGRVKGGTAKAARTEAEALAARQGERLRTVLTAAVARLGLSSILVDDGAGAAALALEWAGKAGIPAERFERDAATYGKTAEPINHERMFNAGKPDLAIVFPGKWETEDVIEKARAAGVRVIEIDRQ